MSDETSWVIIPAEVWMRIVGGIRDRIDFEPQVIVSEAEYARFVLENAADIDVELLDEVAQYPTFSLKKQP